MSEVEARPAPTRGRGSVRGGRGGFGRGGPRGGSHRQANGTNKDHNEPALEEQGEIGDLKKQYSSQLPVLKDMFPDWTDVDLVFALQETSGELETTIMHITEGHVSQFSEIKKPKDRARSKVKDSSLPEQISSAFRGARGGRGVADAGRGGRGRGDRGRGAPRGGRGGSAALPKEAHTDAGTAADAGALEPAADTKDTATAKTTQSTSTETAEPATAKEAVIETVSNVAAAAKKTWASMFNQPKPPPEAPKPAARPVDKPAQPAEAVPAKEEQSTMETPEEQPQTPSISVDRPAEASTSAAALAEPHDPLTEDNLEHLPDSSAPIATHTAASTVGSTDVRLATPLAPGPQAIGGKALGGYASTALRATSGFSRSSSYQRRLAEQQEAVVLPGHSSVDRAAVQFGSMGLNGDGADVDEDREEAETRAQPPAQSPQAQPRAALPPASASAAQDTLGGQAGATPKPAPGLPPVSLQQQQQQLAQHGAQEVPSGNAHQSYNQYERYGQQESQPSQQKAYDPFSQQTPSFDQFGGQNQGQSQASQHGQESGYGGFSAAPSEYSQYYTAEQQRYQNYYGNQYNQQQSHGQQDSHAQRPGATTTGHGDSAYGSHQGTQQHQGRYSELPSSGQAAPSSYGGQQSGPTQQAQQPSQQQQQHQQSQYNSSFPYGHPYYQSPYAQAYQTQFNGYQQPSYGSSYGKGGGNYGQTQGYGGYDHAASPATSGYTQPSAQQSSQPAREQGHGGASSDYGRSSTQPTSASGSGFGGGISDYGRAQSGYGQSQPHGYGAQQSSGQEDLKSYESKTGPSPGLSAQQGRPGSTVHSTSGQPSQSGLPPPQSQQGQQQQGQQQQQQQQGFGGYPGFNQGSGYGSSGLGALGAQHNGAQQGAYSQYGGNYGQQSYSQYQNRGWGGSGYGQQ